MLRWAKFHQQENEMYSDPPRFEDTEVHAHPSSNVNSLPVNSAQQDAKFAVGAKKLPPVRTSGASTTFEPKAEPAGQEMPQLFQGDTHSSHLNGQRCTASSTSKLPNIWGILVHY